MCAVTVHVVGAALLRDRHVLAARRVRPPGGWEFPGGKVEAGETGPAALARELAEELGVAAVIGDRVAEASDGRIHLVLYTATASGEPAAGADHDELRWLAAADLEGLAWLPIDRDLLPAVRALLERGGQG
jgi:8-oxo-dGTP diphosphatase